MSQKQRKLANQQKLKSEMTRAQASTNKSLTLAKAKPLPQRPQKKKNPPKPLPKVPQKKESPMLKESLKCGLQYFSALLDPWATPEGPCVPYGFPTPSRRDKCITRGTFALGTTGQGYIAYQPSTAYDVANLAYTQSTSVGTASTALQSFTNLATSAPSHLPYGSASIVTNSTVNSRFVAGGVRIRYKGTEAGRNGTTYAYEEPNHGNPTTLTGTQLLAAPQVKPMRPQPEGEWITALWSGPVSAAECDFGNTSLYNNVTKPIVIYIDGTAGDTYEYEAVVHVEYNGQAVDGLERSHNNSEKVMDGLAVVKGATEAMPLGSMYPKPLFDEICEVMDTTARKAIRAIPDLLDVIAPTMFALLL